MNNKTCEHKNNPDYELVCDTCGHDNSNSLFAKNEGETCRQMGCFGTMKWAPKQKKPFKHPNENSPCL